MVGPSGQPATALCRIQKSPSLITGHLFQELWMKTKCVLEICISYKSLMSVVDYLKHVLDHLNHN